MTFAKSSIACGWHRLFVVYASRRITLEEYFDLCVAGCLFLPVFLSLILVLFVFFLIAILHDGRQ